jgi:hypothetical protein
MFLSCVLLTRTRTASLEFQVEGCVLFVSLWAGRQDYLTGVVLIAGDLYLNWNCVVDRYAIYMLCNLFTVL